MYQTLYTFHILLFIDQWEENLKVNRSLAWWSMTCQKTCTKDRTREWDIAPSFTVSSSAPGQPQVWNAPHHQSMSSSQPWKESGVPWQGGDSWGGRSHLTPTLRASTPGRAGRAACNPAQQPGAAFTAHTGKVLQSFPRSHDQYWFTA